MSANDVGYGSCRFLKIPWFWLIFRFLSTVIILSEYPAVPETEPDPGRLGLTVPTLSSLDVDGLHQDLPGAGPADPALTLVTLRTVHGLQTSCTA